MKKLVSVIMPAYNCAEYIGDSIRSVQAQTYTDWELIIADDNSKDDTVRIVKEFADADSRIVLIESQENLGPAGARNKAIEAATGTYMAFLDSDDIWHAEKLERQTAFMEENGYDFSFTSYEKIDENAEKLGIVVRAPEKVDYNRLLYLGDPIGNLTVVFNADIIGKHMVPDIQKRNDFALWLSILKDNEYAYGLDEVLAQYRIRGGSVSSKKLRLIKYHWKLYREIEELSLPKCAAAIASLLVVKQFKMVREYFTKQKYKIAQSKK